MGKFNLISAQCLVLIFLSGCGGQSLTSQINFDVNSDIAAIQNAVSVHQDLSESANSDYSIENLARVSDLYPAALDEIERNTNILLTHITDNWNSIGPGDSPEGISREVLKEWGEAYLFWVNYQRKIQTIGEECLSNLETFDFCRIQNLGQTMELERKSIEPLNVAQAKIQAWQEKYANQ